MTHTGGIGGDLRSPWIAHLTPEPLTPMSRPLQEFSGLGRAILCKIPEADLTNGVTARGPAATMKVADGRTVGVQLDATAWATDTAKTLTVGLEQSMDGGQSWRHLCSITTHSGLRATGNAMPYVWATIEGDTLVRPFMEATGQSLTVGCTVTGG